jgi:hypothetical protein
MEMDGWDWCISVVTYSIFILLLSLPDHEVSELCGYSGASPRKIDSFTTANRVHQPLTIY